VVNGLQRSMIGVGSRSDGMGTVSLAITDIKVCWKNERTGDVTENYI